MIPLNISYLIWASWKPRLQSYVQCRNALWRNRSYPNSNFSFTWNIIMTKQSQLTTKYRGQFIKNRNTVIAIIADYIYSILRCDFFGKKSAMRLPSLLWSIRYLLRYVKLRLPIYEIFLTFRTEKYFRIRKWKFRKTFRKNVNKYRVSMSLSGKATSLFIYFTYVLVPVQARTEV